MMQWLNEHEALLWWLGALSVLMFIATLAAIPVLVVRMPADYFMHGDRPRHERWAPRHPAVHWTLIILKNAIGLVLLVAGVVLLVLPGQGVLTLFIGLTLVDFPGKHRIELALVRRPAIRCALDWMRRKRHKPPLQIPDKAKPVR